MPSTTLLTSFAPWKANHWSNSADDLLQDLLADLAHRETQGETHLESKLSPTSLHFLRQLPVNFPVAHSIVTHKINQLQPRLVLCCGMAESRHKLSLESNAVCQTQQLYTSIDLDGLAAGLTQTEISHDAGRFVCNALYYGILNYLKCYSPDTLCLFVHIPVLTPNNRKGIVADFWAILERLELKT
ncbi:pyroglutamyl-peptidase I family protein [Egbenema bharatensis]|uniref:pyroglutamyl-peptidase I family protein n=1 Tax=Egbenema bharatensis TaxID=3463334 RepID=UPI003A8ABDBB